MYVLMILELASQNLFLVDLCKGLNVKQTMQLGRNELIYATLLMVFWFGVATNVIWNLAYTDIVGQIS